jgi:hypothetical protein
LTDSQPQEAGSSDSADEPAVQMSFAEFLQSCPPETEKFVSDLLRYKQNYSSAIFLGNPDLRLHCEHEDCNGIRTFYCQNEPTISGNWDLKFLTYVCRNCRQTTKSFALVVCKKGRTTGLVYKFGELPIFGPPTPSRLISLVGEDRELFLKGRRAELRGLGIGAFAYYRRVVENQKGRIIEEIGKVAARLGATKKTLQLFDEAKAETQFSTAIEKIKSAIPESLLIDGQHNPLTLLHTALSEWLHEKTDKECLELATSIRLVLAELAERISAALKDEAELRGAVTKLLNRKASPESK